MLASQDYQSKKRCIIRMIKKFKRQFDRFRNKVNSLDTKP